MLDLKQRKCDSWNKKSCIANIVFPQTKAGKKYCLSRGLKIEQVWPDPGNKYNINVSFEAIYSQMIRTNKKIFIFRQGNCTMDVLYPAQSKSFVFSICSKDPMKTQHLDIFARARTAKCIAGCNHNGSLENEYCFMFLKLKLKFLIPTLHHIFYSPKPSNIYRKSSFLSSV